MAARSSHNSWCSSSLMRRSWLLLGTRISLNSTSQTFSKKALGEIDLGASSSLTTYLLAKHLHPSLSVCLPSYDTPYYYVNEISVQQHCGTKAETNHLRLMSKRV